MALHPLWILQTPTSLLSGYLLGWSPCNRFHWHDCQGFRSATVLLSQDLAVSVSVTIRLTVRWLIMSSSRNATKVWSDFDARHGKPIDSEKPLCSWQFYIGMVRTWNKWDGSQILDWFSFSFFFTHEATKISKYHEKGEGCVKESLPPKFVLDCILCLLLPCFVGFCSIFIYFIAANCSVKWINYVFFFLLEKDECR